MKDLKQEYVCIYCGHKDILSKFLIFSGTGYRKDRCKCPTCKVGFSYNKLTSDITIFDWGAWVYWELRAGRKDPHIRDRLRYEDIKINVSKENRNYRNQFWDGFNFMKDHYNQDGSEIFNRIIRDMNRKENAYKQSKLV